MNSDTGQLRGITDELPLNKEIEIAILKKQLTKKQKECGWVSLHDNRSIAGKKLQKARKKKKIAKASKKKNRRH